MNRWAWEAALACASLATWGCGGARHAAAHDAGTPANAAPDAGSAETADAGLDAGFQPAPHEPFPQVPDHAGGVLAHPRLVTITFAGYAYQQEAQDFGDFVVGSQWLQTVGADYGVGSATHLKKVVLTDTAPSAITSAAIEAFLESKIQDGTLPAPASAKGEELYVIYYPEATTVTELDPRGRPVGTSCQDFGGYHGEAQSGSLDFAYAVIPSCSNIAGMSAADELTYYASHEFIEAATDPWWKSAPGFIISDLPGDPWAFMAGEVADLCGALTTREGNFALQRVWSNTAAAAGREPCIPSNEPFYGVTATPAQSVAVSGGQTVTFQIKAWSSAAVANWTIAAVPLGGTFDAAPALDRTTVNNGDTATLTLTIPQGLARYSYALVGVDSYRTAGGDFKEWPVVVYVP